MVVIDDHDFTSFPELTNEQLEQFGLVSPHPQITRDFTAKVVNVHDGDTVTLRTDFRDFDFPLRLASVDSPELNTGTPGEEARDYLIGFVLDEEVLIKIDRNNRVGKFGRLLGDIVAGGVNMSEIMVGAGHAVPFQFRRDFELPDPNKTFAVAQWF